MPLYRVHVVHTYCAAGDFDVEAESEAAAEYDGRTLAEGTLFFPELVDVEVSVTLKEQEATQC